jgi:hypothetical protein
VSATAAATGTISIWIPLISAGIGAGAAVIAGVITQVWSSHRDKRQWERERCERRVQWDREHQTRQELWAREDSKQWLRDRQQTYAKFVSTLFEWDAALGSAMTKVRLGDSDSSNTGRAWDERRSARAQLTLVQFMAPQEVREKAGSAVREREEFLLFRLRVPGTTDASITKDWNKVMGTLRELVEAMRNDLGLEIAPGDLTALAPMVTPSEGGKPSPGTPAE